MCRNVFSSLAGPPLENGIDFLLNPLLIIFTRAGRIRLAVGNPDIRRNAEPFFIDMFQKFQYLFFPSL